MIYYKGFNENLQCIVEGKIFQYEIGKTYEEPEAKLCKSGNAFFNFFPTFFLLDLNKPAFVDIVVLFFLFVKIH